MSRSIRLLVLAALATGCMPPLAPPTPDEPGQSPVVAPGAGEGSARVGPRVVVEESFGTDGEQARTAAARVRSRIEECELGGTGAVQVRVSPDPSGDGLRVTIGRGRPLRGAERQCVMAALQTLDVDDLSARSSPSNRAADTYVLLRVEW